MRMAQCFEGIGDPALLGKLERHTRAPDALSRLRKEENVDPHAVDPSPTTQYAPRMPEDNPPRRDEVWPGNGEADPSPIPAPAEAIIEAATNPPDTAEPIDAAFEPGLPLEPPDAERDRVGRSLSLWLVVLVAFGLGGLFAGQQEMAALVAMAGMFVTAQAADLEPRWKGLYYLISWITPLLGVAALLVSAFALYRSDWTSPMRPVVFGITLGGAVLSLLTIFRPFSNGLAAALFRTSAPSHTLRLTGRLVLVGFLFAIPGWFMFRYVLNSFQDAGPLFERGTLEGGLIGYVLLALASVGFMVRRNIRQTLARLGLLRISRRDLGIIVLGVVGLYALNAGADWIQHRYFPGLWQSDHDINETIAKGLGPVEVILLGLSAGIGEELTLRGALQPRLGLIQTSLLFASFHVQYSWFGIAVIFLLGLILGTIRQRTSTTVAIAVHVVYDMLAVLSV